MPGVIASAAPTAVLPQPLCSAFTQLTESRQFPMLQMYYHDGTLERSLITDTVNAPRPLRIWSLSKRLTTAQLAALLTFWESTVKGGLKPFYFYDPYAVTPLGSNYDPTGANLTGRVTVFLRGNWAQQTDISLHAVSLTLVEVL